MIAGGISQLHNVDGDLAELKATVTAVYRVMRQLILEDWHTSFCAKRRRHWHKLV
jgi:uncharacterized protein YecA (UPF0149 family)